MRGLRDPVMLARMRRRASDPPPDFANLRGWLDAGDLDGAQNATLNDGDAIVAAPNKGSLSGIWAPLTAGGATLDEAGGIGGAPSVAFGVSQFLQSSLTAADWDFVNGAAVAAYVVLRSNAPNLPSLFRTKTGTLGRGAHLYVNGSTGNRLTLDFRSSANESIVCDVDTVPAGDHLVEMHIDPGTTTADIELLVNGLLRGSLVASWTSTPVTPSHSMRVGPAIIAGTLMRFHQVLFYEAIHDAPTRAAVRAFLYAKVNGGLP